MREAACSQGFWTSLTIDRSSINTKKDSIRAFHMAFGHLQLGFPRSARCVPKHEKTRLYGLPLISLGNVCLAHSPLAALHFSMPNAFACCVISLTPSPFALCFSMRCEQSRQVIKQDSRGTMMVRRGRRQGQQ